jgi:hypothetical protein
MAEIDKMIQLVYTTLPNKILYFATLRDKVAMPREESGTAKFIDSADEMANLLEKAQQMENIENAIVRLAMMWEKDTSEFTITYNKIFDIKSINEQIAEIVEIFKQDLGSLSFNKEIVKRLMFNMLGHVSEDLKKKIDSDLEFTIDPGLNIEDIGTLIQTGIVNAVQMVRKYNPEYRDKEDDEIQKFIAENLAMMMGVSTAETDSNIEGEAGVPEAVLLNGIQIKAASDIVKAVSDGELPRDSGLNQLMVFLNLNKEQAEAVMGKAGTGKVIKKDKVINEPKPTGVPNEV